MKNSDSISMDVDAPVAEQTRYVDLYLDDSSDEEEVYPKYKDTVTNSISNSSLALAEIASSILEHPTIRGEYLTKKAAAYEGLLSKKNVKKLHDTVRENTQNVVDHITKTYCSAFKTLKKKESLDDIKSFIEGQFGKEVKSTKYISNIDSFNEANSNDQVTGFVTEYYQKNNPTKSTMLQQIISKEQKILIKAMYKYTPEDLDLKQYHVSDQILEDNQAMNLVEACLTHAATSAVAPSDDFSVNSKDLKTFYKYHVHYPKLLKLSNIFLEQWNMQQASSNAEEAEEAEDAREYLSQLKLDFKIVRCKLKEVLYTNSHIKWGKESSTNLDSLGQKKYVSGSMFYQKHIDDVLIRGTIDINSGVSNAKGKDAITPARKDLRMLESGSPYETYANLMLRLGSSQRDAENIKNVIQYCIKPDASNKDKLKQIEDRDFLINFAHLLMNCEVQRNVSALLTNTMFFESIKQNATQDSNREINAYDINKAETNREKAYAALERAEYLAMKTKDVVAHLDKAQKAYDKSLESISNKKQRSEITVLNKKEGSAKVDLFKAQKAMILPKKKKAEGKKAVEEVLKKANNNLEDAKKALQEATQVKNQFIKSEEINLDGNLEKNLEKATKYVIDKNNDNIALDAKKTYDKAQEALDNASFYKSQKTKANSKTSDDKKNKESSRDIAKEASEKALKNSTFSNSDSVHDYDDDDDSATTNESKSEDSQEKAQVIIAQVSLKAAEKALTKVKTANQIKEAETQADENLKQAQKQVNNAEKAYKQAEEKVTSATAEVEKARVTSDEAQNQANQALSNVNRIREQTSSSISKQIKQKIAEKKQELEQKCEDAQDVAKKAEAEHTKAKAANEKAKEALNQANAYYQDTQGGAKKAEAEHTKAKAANEKAKQEAAKAVQDAEYTIQDYSIISLPTKLPMAMVGAVDASRHILSSMNLKKMLYDYKGAPGEDAKHVKKIKSLNETLRKKWDADTSGQNYFVKIKELVKDWYGIDLEYLGELPPPTTPSPGKRTAKQALDGEGFELLEKLESKWYNVYTDDAMNNMLNLRLKTLDKVDSVESLVVDSIFDGNMRTANLITHEIIKGFNSLKVQQDKLLVVINLYAKHWVGIVLDKSEDNNVNISYIDPEQKEIPEELRASLLDIFTHQQQQGSVELECITQEKQKSNNCGPEVVESFIENIMGCEYRYPQEDAVILHSSLLESNLLGNTEDVCPY